VSRKNEGNEPERKNGRKGRERKLTKNIFS